MRAGFSRGWVGLSSCQLRSYSEAFALSPPRPEFQPGVNKEIATRNFMALVRRCCCLCFYEKIFRMYHLRAERFLPTITWFEDLRTRDFMLYSCLVIVPECDPLASKTATARREAMKTTGSALPQAASVSVD